MKKRFTLLLSFLTVFLVTGWQIAIKAQSSNSVKVQLQVNKPYSVYLNDYVASGSDRLKLMLSYSDVDIHEIKVRLKIKIEGTGNTVITKENFRPSSAIILTSGLPEFLSGEDLYEYFNPANLEFLGQGLDDFRKTTRIPEDYYKFCVQVIDNDRNVILKEYNCELPVWIVKNPPAEAKKAIEEGKSLIAQGKAMVAAGNDAEGESLIERGKKKLSEGAKGAIDAARNLPKTIVQTADQLKALFEKVLKAKRDTSIADSSRKAKKIEDDEKEYQELKLAFNGAESEPTESISEEDFAYEQADANPDKAPEEVKELAGKSSKIHGSYIDLSRLAIIIPFLKNKISNPIDFDALLNDFKKDAKDILKNYALNALQGKDQQAIEVQIKSYIEKKVTEQLK